MNALTDHALIEQIDGFLDRTGMKPTRFGRLATGQSHLIQTLREGRSPSLRTANRILEFMRLHEVTEPEENAKQLNHGAASSSMGATGS